jgi:synaptojanin
MSGNKGAVGIRLEFHDSSFCFLTAHLAAGHSNVEERNADYWTIANGIKFLRGKRIEGHEYVTCHTQYHMFLSDHRSVIWLADTNYRIDLDNETVRALALSDDVDGLLAADQVCFRPIK